MRFKTDISCYSFIKKFAIIFSLIPALSWGAFSNYNSILIGDQAAGMAGAYTAMTEDASALAWYNPAALAKLQGQAFSAAVGIYKKFDTSYNTSEDLSRASMRANQGFFRALPSSTGSVLKFEDESMKDYMFGLSIVTPEYDTFKGEIFNDGTSSSTLSLLDESLWVGGAIAKKIDEKQSIGITIYYTSRSLSKSVMDRQSISSTQAKIFSEERALVQNALVYHVGYHLDITETLKFGFMARLPSTHLYGKATYMDSFVDPTGVGVTSNNLQNVETKARVPRKYSLGLAYVNPSKVLSIAADISYYEPMSYSDIEHPTLREYIVHNPVWNLSVGGEGWIRSWLKLRLGVFSNLSAHPNPEPGLVSGQGDRVDQLGWSANTALIKGNIQYTFGGYYTGGWGRSVQRINQEYVVVPKQVQVFTMLVGTSYYF